MDDPRRPHQESHRPHRASVAAGAIDPSRLPATRRERSRIPRTQGPVQRLRQAKAVLDKASGVKGWRLHDLRRTVATGLQRLGVRLEVTEAVLNHVSGSRAGIVGVYQRHDWAEEKRAALNAWGEHVDAIVEGREATGKVTAFRRG
jgi:integrase